MADVSKIFPPTTP